MLSRDADSCYWIGRYVERVEATARMVDVHYHAALESSPIPIDSTEVLQDLPDNRLMRWQSLLAISANEEDFAKRYDRQTDRDVLHFFAFDPANPNSILSAWKSARGNARGIRELIASEMWESLNIFYLELLTWDVDRVLAGGPHLFFRDVKNASHLFQGILNRTMMMGETRDWLDAGRFLERSVQTARLLDVKYHDLLPATIAKNDRREAGIESAGGSSTTVNAGTGTAEQDPAPTLRYPLPDPYGVGGPLDVHGWIAVLKSVSAFEMYRKTHRAGITPSKVVDFLLLCPDFPASVRHGIGRVDGCLRRISGTTSLAPGSESERLLGRLAADLTYTSARDIVKNGLHEFLQTVQIQCEAIGNAITDTYLIY